MAEMDPVSIAQAGVDPVTGSPLSSEVRKALFRRSSITSSSVFGVFVNISRERISYGSSYKTATILLLSLLLLFK